MSTHLIDCVGEMDLPPSTKLALLAFADSADKVTRIAHPDRSRVEKWACVSRSRCNEIVKDLTDQGFLVRRSAGRKGHTAEFYVLPFGCCVMHGPVELEVLDPKPGNEGAGIPAPKKADRGAGIAAGPGRPLCNSEGVDTSITKGAGIAAGPGRPLQSKESPIGAGIGAGIGATPDRPPSVSPYLPNSSLRSELDACPRATFQDFWSAYPRKAGKRKAEFEWDRAIKRADPNHIVQAALRYRNDPNRTDEFTAHPSTWLHQDRWGDDPLPARSSRRPTQTETSLGWLNVGTEAEQEHPQLRAIEGGSR